MKESIAILKYSFRTVNKKVYIWAGLGGILLGIFLGGTLLAGQAIELDMNGEKVVHSSCLVSEMPVLHYSNGKTTTSTTYGLRTSCGDFKANKSLHETMSLNETYNLTATAGNWANKPTVVSAEIIVK